MKDFIKLTTFKSKVFNNMDIEQNIYININRIRAMSKLNVNNDTAVPSDTVNNVYRNCFLIKLSDKDSNQLSVPSEFMICKKDNPDAYNTLSERY